MKPVAMVAVDVAINAFDSNDSTPTTDARRATACPKIGSGNS